MSPLESTLRLSGSVGSLRSVTSPVARADDELTRVATAPSPVQARPSPSTPASAPPGTGRPFLSAISPQAIIRQAELLLQITAAAASSPALREIAAAAYQMEIDARREMARARLEGMTAGHQWFA